MLTTFHLLCYHLAAVLFPLSALLFILLALLPIPISAITLGLTKICFALSPVRTPCFKLIGHVVAGEVLGATGFFFSHLNGNRENPPVSA